jgi:PAS domain S-box-containing protein
MFGYSADEALGAHISLIVPEDRRTEADAIMRRLLGPTLRARLTPRARAVGNR